MSLACIFMICRIWKWLKKILKYLSLTVCLAVSVYWEGLEDGGWKNDKRELGYKKGEGGIDQDSCLLFIFLRIIRLVDKKNILLLDIHSVVSCCLSLNTLQTSHRTAQGNSSSTRLASVFHHSLLQKRNLLGMRELKDVAYSVRIQSSLHRSMRICTSLLPQLVGYVLPVLLWQWYVAGSGGGVSWCRKIM